MALGVMMRLTWNRKLESLLSPEMGIPVDSGALLSAYDDVGEIWESEATILDIEGCDAL